MTHSFLTTVLNAVYPDGSRGPVYALVGVEHRTGAAVTVKLAYELQTKQGLEFRTTGFTPESFGAWFGPDFPQIGKSRDSHRPDPPLELA